MSTRNDKINITGYETRLGSSKFNCIIKCWEVNDVQFHVNFIFFDFVYEGILSPSTSEEMFV